MKCVNIVGARPNFMKIAPFQRELDQKGHEYKLVHTGQHYDQEMSDTFFEDLQLEAPDVNLGVGSNTHSVQTARIMERLEPVLDQEQPDWVVVVGDVNSTLSAALVASKKDVKLAHIEGGIRSGNRDMPEEVNRVVVDQLSDAIFCFDRESEENLEKEGIPSDKIFRSGDIMIDSLHLTLENQGNENADLNPPDQFALLTMHRPSNVDRKQDLERAFDSLVEVQKKLPIIYPVHPRTEEQLKEHDLYERWRETFHLTDPLGYADFVNLMQQAEVVITDSGSIQQETTVLDVPCLTVRDETERGITIRRGTNELVDWGPPVEKAVEQIRSGNWKSADEIEHWDGQTAERIVSRLEEIQETS